MNPSLSLASPGFGILFKWTGLLALGWMADWMLRRRHPRWRLILWRSVLCLGLIVPLLPFFALPGIKIPVASDAATPITGFAGSTAPAAGKPIKPAAIVAPSQARQVAASGAIFLQAPTPAKAVPWGNIILAAWILGFLFGAVRLVRLHLQLIGLRNETCRPNPVLQRLAQQIQVRLKVRREVDVQISATIISPFVCGLLKPVIILPQRLAQDFSLRELSALLSHEMAHLRQHDLVWCVVWRWMKALCWFHPLVWHVPAAHNLACEQEADRCASEQLADQATYAQLLARLALRVLTLPAIETKLTLNGSSQIARRLNHLAQKGKRAWTWRHSAAGFGLAGLLFLLTAGCNFSRDSRNLTAGGFKQVLVVVQDQDGQPIEGATISPSGFRVKGIHGPDAYGWNEKLFGPREKLITDRNGKAYVKYPVMGIPEEKELTGKLILWVSHPEYSTVGVQSFSVDSPEQPIQLNRGIRLEVSGYYGSDHQPVTELVPNLSEESVRPEDWQKNEKGVFAFHKLSPGDHLLQLMGRLPSGEIVYSDGMAFNAENGKEYNFAMEMKPGIRLEGRIDDKVPRPVKNGRVLICVRPKEFPAWLKWEDVDAIYKKYENVRFWKSYRTIAEDGTFVFESIPPGGLDVIACGDGFVSQKGGETGHGFEVPQAFALAAPTTRIELATEPSATLEVTVKTKFWGKPVEGASIFVNPNVVRINGIFGDMRESSEKPFRTLAPLPNLPYSAITDKNGVAVMRNLPGITDAMEVYHPQFQVPLQEPHGWRDRRIRVELSPGTTNKVEVTLESKVSDYISRNWLITNL